MAADTVAGFAHILNWRLLRGSHPFPGPDGGTCINEAALVAAGLPYRAIGASTDCPPCFSRSLAAYALGLNDAMPDAERGRLMAFVLRLSGSADTAEIEGARTACLVLGSVRRILPPLLDGAGLPAEAARCETASDLATALAATRTAGWRAGSRAETAARVGAWVVGAWAAAAARACTAALLAADDARCAAEVAEAAAPFAPGTWGQAVALLDEALGIGRQAPAIDLIRARDRLAAARAIHA